MPSFHSFPLARALLVAPRHLPTYLRTQGPLVLAAAVSPIAATVFVLWKIRGSFAAVFTEGSAGVFRIGVSPPEAFGTLAAFLIGCVCVGVGMIVTESVVAGERITLRQALRAFRLHAGVFFLFCLLLLGAYLLLSILPILVTFAAWELYSAIADPAPSDAVTYVDMSGWRAALLFSVFLTALAPFVRAAGTALFEGDFLGSLRAGFRGPFSRQVGLGASVAVLLFATERAAAAAFGAFTAPVIQGFGSASTLFGTGFLLLLAGWIVKTLLWLAAALLAGIILYFAIEERPTPGMAAV